uniref:UDP-glucuronosyltransferase n=1 Tax=Gadus morhua TaxID=8049 RepID=A0A8C5FG12_GADMO
MPSLGNHIFFTVALIPLLFTAPSDGGKVLVYPVDGSHWINMKIVIEELHARGHSIDVIRASDSCIITCNYWHVCISPMFISLHFLHQAQRERASVFTFLKLTSQFMSMISKAHSVNCDMLGQILDDESLVQRLSDAQYDLVLTDPAIATGVVLAKYLKLPLVLNVRWITSGDGQFAIAPSPLSYVPVPGSGLTDKMSFTEFMVGPTDIWLFRSDFVFDFPRPTMPNVVYIGGFQCKPAQPLPSGLEEFVQSAGEHGVIIMTLGTLVNALPDDIAEEIASVFARMPQKVIWRNIGKRPSTLGNNTLIVDWMPQKDLLGHPQTKVFVAHGGTNGVQEAIYYGVPVLGIPLFFDQYDNLLRLQERGAGKILKLAEVNGRTFEQGLGEVLHQDSYRNNMQRLSRLHRDQPIPPLEHAIFWTEYVMRHKGAPHLRTESYRMPWYSYYSIDVMMTLLAAVTIFLLSIVIMFRFLCCRGRRISKSKIH